MWKSIVQKQLSYNRNKEVAYKVNLFFEADRLGNVHLACLRMKCKRSFYYFWWGRFKRGGWDIKSLEERTRKPYGHPNTTPQSTVDLIKLIRIQRGCGKARIAYYLSKDYGLSVPQSTIGHVLKREGLIVAKKKVKPKQIHTKRYEMENPGDVVQVDVKYVPELIRGERHYQFTAIDDCSRWRFAMIFPEKSTYSTKVFVELLLQAAPFVIRCIQTDNGTEFTYVFVSNLKCTQKEPAEHVLDELCRKHGIRHKLIPVATPQINGKVERSHRTDDEEFYNGRKYSDPKQLEADFLAWNHYYNYERPHGGIGMQTPAEKLFKKLAA